MSMTPGDTRKNGFGEQFVFERIDGTKLYVWDSQNKLVAISQSAWEAMIPVRSASQVRLFE